MINGTCRGLTYDYEKAQGTLLIAATDDKMRVMNRWDANGYTFDGRSTDAYIVIISDSK